MGKKLQEWVDTEVRPFRDKPVSLVSQYHFFRDPIRPTYSDLSYFFSPADGIILYQRIVRPDECIVEMKGKVYSLRDSLRIPLYLAQPYYLLQIADYDVDCITPFNVKHNQPVAQGQRFSQVRYGSQVDLIVPLSSRFAFDTVWEQAITWRRGSTPLSRSRKEQHHN